MKNIYIFFFLTIRVQKNRINLTYRKLKTKKNTTTPRCIVINYRSPSAPRSIRKITPGERRRHKMNEDNEN